MTFGAPPRATVVRGFGILALGIAASSAARCPEAYAQSGGAAGATPDYEVSLVASPDAAEPPALAAPAPLAVDDAPPVGHAESVHETTLHATLDPVRHVITGSEHIEWRNASRASTDELYFHLYLNAFKNQRSVFLRGALGPGRGDSAPAEWGYVDVKSLRVRQADDAGSTRELWPPALRTSPGDEDDETDLRVALPSPCPPGGRLVVDIEFEAKLPSVVERTGFVGSFHMAAQWFPKLARRTEAGIWNHFTFHRLSEFDADFGGYDVTIDVPSAFAVGATGTLSDEQIANGRRVVRYVQRDVHDFAWAAWDAFVERRERIGDVDVRALFPRGYEAAAARELDTVRGAMACYGRRYGGYPYPTLTVIHPPTGADEAGGMEYPTLITTGGPWYGPPGVRVVETVTLHEFGHQTFYGLLASDEHAFPFLDEGLNSYAESVCMDELYGGGSAVDWPWLRVRNAAVQRAIDRGVASDEIVAQPAPAFPSARHYGGLVYARTAELLRSLAASYGAEHVDGALARYARRNRFGHPGPPELLAAFRDEGDPWLEGALRAGLYERGEVDFVASELSVTSQSTPGGIFDKATGRETIAAGSTTGRFVGSALVVRRGPVAMPVPITLTFADGTTRRLSWDGRGRWARVTATSTSPLMSLEIDPERRIEIDVDFANNAVRVDPPRIAPRVFERTWYALALAAFGFGP